ncbi:MAG: NERD domain-containing protein [Promethearchaeota archaeon]
MDEKKLNVDDLCKELYLFYEFEIPNHPKIEFQSGIDVFKKSSFIINEDEILTVDSLGSQKTSDKNYHGRFDPKSLIHNSDGSFEYSPLNLSFPTIFKCVEYLQQFFTIEDIFSGFSWQEFEGFVCNALDHYGYHAFRTFRFSLGSQRHEIDVIARNQNIIFFIDAKRWKNRTPTDSVMKKMALDQLKRVQDFIRCPVAIQKLKDKLHLSNNHTLPDNKHYKIYPIILFSTPFSQISFYEGVPVLSFTLFNDFLVNFFQIQDNINFLEF